MELHGQVIQVMPVKQGQSQRTGQVWASQGFVLHIDGQYERNVKLSLWGPERIQAANLQLGTYITAKFEIEAHEHNGEWYNDCRVYDIISNGRSLLRANRQAQPTNQQQNAGAQQMQQYQQIQQPSYQQGAPSYQQAPMTQQQFAQAQQNDPRPW